MGYLFLCTVSTYLEFLCELYVLCTVSTYLELLGKLYVDLVSVLHKHTVRLRDLLQDLPVFITKQDVLVRK